MAKKLNHLSLIATAAAVFCSSAAPAQTLPTVTITSRAEAPVGIGGFGDTPVAKLPLQASVISNERLTDLGISALAGITSLDASISDAYNAQGYASYLKIRGFDLGNRFNYRRDGLPINAETTLPLGNKSALEVLKGTSGIQAGTSAPGGLVNLVVKRPVGTSSATDSTTVGLAFSERGTAEATLDLNRRITPAIGLRINASAAHLDPLLRDAKGSRHLLAAAADWKISPDTWVEAEFELSRQSQPSQPGFSMLGNVLPSADSIDPRTNLNNQPWSLPNVFNGQTASLRVSQRLSQDWRAQAHLGMQRLKSDDRLAYAFGCYDAAADIYYADRYCPNGNFDQYDFRSDGEKRNSDALDLSLAGKFIAAGMRHDISTGVLFSRFKSRFGGQAYNYAGTGNISGQLVTTPDPTLNDANTNRDERSTELYLRDAVQLTAQWQAWLGLRATHLQRESRRVNTSATRPTDYAQTFTTPWLGLSYAINSQLMAYASWGQGTESEVAPNRSRYSNSGQALPALKSDQLELGLKAGSSTVDWSVNAFDVKRPQFRDIGACDVANSCVRQADGHARHRGVEAQADLKWAGGGLLASAMRLHARNVGSIEASLNGLKPANTPESTLKLQARQSVLPGLLLQAGLVYEGPRAVLPDNSVNIPGWTRLDAGARFEQSLGNKQVLTWRIGVDNLADRRAWKESPYQYEHVYLYPLAGRTWRASVEVQL